MRPAFRNDVGVWLVSLAFRSFATARMFFFFSNRLGCLGSLLISALITVALLFVFGMLRF